MSEAELKKLEELKKFKAMAKDKKKAAAKTDEDPLPKIQMDSLPPVMMQRKGGFEMIPDFLKQKELVRDMTELGVADMMGASMKPKAEEENQPSMKELFEAKRKAAEE